MTTNLLDATLAHTDDGVELTLTGGAVLHRAGTVELPPGPVVVALEPESLRLAAPWEPNTFLARVERIAPDGERNRLELAIVGHRLILVDPTLTHLEPGVTVALAVDPAALRVLARRSDA